MPDWKCARCGAINLEWQRACEGCGKEVATAESVGSLLNSVMPGLPRGMHVVRSQPLPEKRPNTTAEQNKAAIQVVRNVAKQKYDAEEGQRRLREIFGAALDEL